MEVPRLPPPNRNVFAISPYPTPQPKPVPMEVDRSIRTKQINYANRPRPNYQFPFRQQGPPRFHVEELTNMDHNYPIQDSSHSSQSYPYIQYPYPPIQTYGDRTNNELPYETNNSNQIYYNTPQNDIHEPQGTQSNPDTEAHDNLNFRIETYPNDPT